MYDISYIFGLASAALVYFVLSYFFPAEETLLSENILDDPGVKAQPEAVWRSVKSDVEVNAVFQGEIEL